MDFSLNAGAELDDEVIAPENPDAVKLEPEDLFQAESIQPGEVPEIKEDLELIASLESRIDDLLYLQADIQKSHGMSQQYAAECERLMPGFGGGTPIGYYSKDISATRYKVSLEELSKGVWALIIAVAAAIVALVTKFIWRMSGKKDGTPSEAKERLQAQKEVFKQDAEVLQTIESAVQEVQGTIEIKVDESPKPRRYKDINDAILDILSDDSRIETIKEFLNSTNPVFHDIVNRGKLTKALEQTLPFLRLLNDSLSQKLDLLESTVEEDRKNAHDARYRTQTEAAMRVLSVPVEVQIAYGGRQSRQGNRGATLTDMADHLARVRSEVRDEHRQEEVMYIELVRSLTKIHRNHYFDTMYRDLSDTVELLENMRKRLDKLHQGLVDMGKDGTTGHSSEGVADKLRKILSGFNQDVTGYTRLVAEIEDYMRTMHSMVDPTKYIAVQFGATIERYYRRHPEQPMKPRWERYLKIMLTIKHDKFVRPQKVFGRKLF